MGSDFGEGVVEVSVEMASGVVGACAEHEEFAWVFASVGWSDDGRGWYPGVFVGPVLWQVGSTDAGFDEFSPLFEKEGDLGGGALVAEGAEPVGVGGACWTAGLSAGDDPV